MPTFTTYREASKDEMGREIDRCHKVIADLEARLARVPSREEVARAICVSRTGFGCICEFQGNPPLCSKHLSAAADAVLSLWERHKGGSDW